MKHCKDCLGEWPIGRNPQHILEGLYHIGALHVLHLHEEISLISEVEPEYLLGRIKLALRKL